MLKGFASLAGILAGAYIGLLWSSLLAHKANLEEDVTHDWPQWVLVGAVAGGVLAFIFVNFVIAAVSQFYHHRAECAMRERIISNESAVGVWPPPPTPPAIIQCAAPDL